MPNGDIEPCPECAKIIINGSRVYSNAEILCDRVKTREDGKLSAEAAKKVIKHLNDAEDSVDAATREYLRGIGYDGALNKALQG